MLKELQIKNFAIIDDITVRFGSGLNILSGETGAGKTLIIEAINLLLGERADNEFIREKEEKLVVQGYFDLSRSRKSIDFLKNENLFDDDDSLSDIVITREVNRQGKNRAFINGIYTQVSTLKTLGKCFLDLHGQHDHQYLLEPESHIDIIDNFVNGQLKNKKIEYGQIYGSFIKLKKQYSDLLKMQEDKDFRLSELKFRLDEIENADFKKGEEDELENEKNVLKNYEKIFNICSQTISLLNGTDNDSPLLEKLSIIVKNITDLSDLDKNYNKFVNDFSGILPLIEEVNAFLRDYMDNLEYNTDRLDKIQERLFSISELKRKYKMDLEEIQKYGQSLKDEIENYESLDFEIDAIKKKFDQSKTHLSEIAVTLSDLRKSAAKSLSARVLKELSELAFKSVEFNVRFEYQTADTSSQSFVTIDDANIKVTNKGIDEIEFLISLNPGESVKPLIKVVSGGEISRIMLALKSIFSGIDDIVTMIFDEIDTGIGGATGIIVGKKLNNISKNCQVICITHLPQIAAFADDHYYIDKVIDNNRTKIKIYKLDNNKKIEEISRMLGGMAESEISIKHAIELLEKTNKIKIEAKEELIRFGN